MPLPQRQMLFTLSDVARLCDRAPATIRRWATDGRIPMQKVGGTWIITRRELVGWFHDLQRLHAADAERWDSVLHPPIPETYIEGSVARWG